MNQLASMDTPALARETALRWQLTNSACPECHCQLYRHQALAALRLGYERCPSCRINYVQRNGVLELDQLADAMLDELSRRMPIILRPAPMLAKIDPVSGELLHTNQPTENPL